MTLRPAVFAIPGDINTLTGGFIYERRLLDGLRAQGREVQHLQLGAGFPDPGEAEMADAVEQLVAIDPERILILDGLVFGSIDTNGLAQVRAPIVAMVHHPLALESGLSEPQRIQLFETERANLRLVRQVLVPSPHTAAILTREYDVAPERITIARPGTERPTRDAKPAVPPLILSVGIQHPRKGHDILLEALARIVDLDWQAVVVGSPYDASCARDLVERVKKLGLSRRVRLAGRVAQEELNGLYARASIFALATRYEGYGIVFDEALANGLPIVSCRTGAVPDTVPPAAGCLVPPEDAEAFSAALTTLLTDTETRHRMAAAARSAGQALPDWTETARVAGQVLDSV